MFCSKCGEKIVKGDNFCRSCGTKIVGNHCLECGAKLTKNSKFCKDCGTKVTTEITNKEDEQEVVVIEEDRYDFAGFWVRFGAFMVDYGIVILLFAIFFILMGILFNEGVNNQVSSFFDNRINDSITTFIVLVLYHTFFLYMMSSTPGKKLFGLSVLEGDDLKPVGPLKGFIRSISYLVSSFLFGLGFINIAVDKQTHKAWHDSIAKTYVTRDLKKNITLGVILAVVGTIAWLCLLSYSYNPANY